MWETIIFATNQYRQTYEIQTDDENIMYMPADGNDLLTCRSAVFYEIQPG